MGGEVGDCEEQRSEIVIMIYWIRKNLFPILKWKKLKSLLCWVYFFHDFLSLKAIKIKISHLATQSSCQMNYKLNMSALCDVQFYFHQTP